ncbi:hypothetical protein [Paenibacillus sp. ISL-20]|uniref:hypothetical protein n=1 Tax=Paenibacillus sp. ISL-20 TaxID=2819163 RepID=UPI001BE4EB0C|nr:hypothetical protein [Paenibacillus sp. ISL-20]MBT2759827.1 hypothetical protein [Paenibacillus sp. ISL-20]
MNDLYIIIIVLAAVVAGLFVVPILKKKNIINKETMEQVSDTFDFVRLVLDVVNVKGIDKNKTNFVLDIADEVATHVGKLYQANDKQDKMTLSLEITESILEKYGVKTSIQEQELIKILVERSIEYAEKMKTE